MIDSITGIVERIDDTTAVIAVNNISYSLVCSAVCIGFLSGEQAQVKLYTYLSVSDNGIVLYGFSDTSERDAFFKLITVPKVGPKVALSILSVYTAAELSVVITSGDIKAMSIPSGVGKKMAENIVLNLKDKFTSSVLLNIDEEAGEASHGVKTDAIGALVALGFDRANAFSAVNAAYTKNISESELIKSALMALSAR